MATAQIAQLALPRQTLIQQRLLIGNLLIGQADFLGLGGNLGGDALALAVQLRQCLGQTIALAGQNGGAGGKNLALAFGLGTDIGLSLIHI